MNESETSNLLDDTGSTSSESSLSKFPILVISDEEELAYASDKDQDELANDKEQEELATDKDQDEFTEFLN